VERILERDWYSCSWYVFDIWHPDVYCWNVL